MRVQYTAIIDGQKQCNKCKCWMPVSLFNIEGRTGSLRSACRRCHSKDSKIRHLKNPEKAKRAVADYRARHAERIARRCRDYRQDEAVRKKCAESAMRRRNINIEAARARDRAAYHADRETWLARRRRWSQQNPDKCKNQIHRRIAMKNSLPADMTPAKWRLVLAHFDGRCAYCGGDGKLSQDHVIPMVKGGGYVWGNIVPACKPCNSSKNSSDCEAWMNRRGFDYAAFTAKLSALRNGVN